MCGLIGVVIIIILEECFITLRSRVTVKNGFRRSRADVYYFVKGDKIAGFRRHRNATVGRSFRPPPTLLYRRPVTSTLRTHVTGTHVVCCMNKTSMSPRHERGGGGGGKQQALDWVGGRGFVGGRSRRLGMRWRVRVRVAGRGSASGATAHLMLERWRRRELHAPVQRVARRPGVQPHPVQLLFQEAHLLFQRRYARVLGL